MSKLLQFKKNIEYKFDPKPFWDFFGKHREHQFHSFKITKTFGIGQILCPCGTGKTRIQATIHIEDMISKLQDNESGVYVIASHRLALNAQLIGQILDVAIPSGLPFDLLFVGSDRPNLACFYTKYYHLGYSPNVSRQLVSTSETEIKNFVEQAKKLNRHTLIVSTYHSFNLLKSLEKINVATFDEAHTIASDKSFFDNIAAVKPIIERQYFFTATRKIAGDNGGMNDVGFFGNVLFDADPGYMIVRGEIASPRLHLISATGKKKTNITDDLMLVENTIKAFAEHKKYIKSNSAEPNKIGAKLLISCNSIDEMNRISLNPDYLSLLHQVGIKSLSVSSKDCNINGKSCSKTEFFETLSSLKNEEDAFIFNVDMLTEGIDLPSITGVMPLRNLGTVKLVQLIGRCLRLFSEDRAKLYSEAIKPKNFKDYIKPYGYIIIPEHLSTLDESDRMIEIIKILYEEYKTPVEEIVIQEKFVYPDNEQLKSMIPFTKSSNKQYDLIHEEFDLVSEYYLDKRARELNQQPTLFDKIQYLERCLGLQ